MARPVDVFVPARFTSCLAVVAFLLALFSGQALHRQTFTVLHTFTGLDGLSPYSGVVMDQGGNLYGTT